MIPLKDYNPTRRFPVVTVLLIAVNIGVYLFVQRPFGSNSDQARFTYEFAAIPCEVVQHRPLSTEEIERRRKLSVAENRIVDEMAPLEEDIKDIVRRERSERPVG